MIRVSGDQAIAISEKLIQKNLKSENAKRALRVFLHSANGKKIDDAVIIPYFSPSSFTGENLVEFFLHGSPLIAQKLLDEIFEAGARLALPGEFSFRAVKNGKIQLSQAEAIKELIQADNDFALELALEKLSGSQHILIEKIQQELMQLLTLSEVGIDFSDQDIDEVSLPRLKQRLKSVLSMLESLKGSFDRGKRLLDGVPVSILGLPNAGKSSFFNALLGEDRSIVSDIAGTTRDIVREKLRLKGAEDYVTFRISDTAGLRKNSDQVEQVGIERSLKAAVEAEIIMVLVDGQNPNLSTLKDFLMKVDFTGKQTLGVITKLDLMNEIEIKKLQDEVKTLPVLNWGRVSSKTAQGMEHIAFELATLGENKLSRKPGEVVLTQFEHVQAVHLSLDCLNRANSAFDLVLFATDVRHGMNELGPMIGQTLPDDVLGKIFSDFCIGK